jgi:WD40 repeat protein
VTGDDDGVVRLWDASSGERTWVFDGHSGPVRDVRFSPDGRMLATASEDGSTRILDLTTGSQLERLRSARAQLLVSAIDRVGFGAGGRILAVASEDRVVLWDANAWTEGRTVIVGRPVNDMSIDPVTGRLALAIDDGTAGVWDQDSGERLATLAGHESSVTAITYDGDGRRIATGGIDGSIRLWDVATGEVTTVLPGHPAAVSALAFSPDGRRLASIGDDGLVRVWSLDLEELLGLAERELTRRLSDDECRRYLHLDACPTSP